MIGDSFEVTSVGNDLERAVTRYCAEWRNPALSPFKVQRHTFTSWHGVPEAAGAGCYAAYAVDGTLLYVGKASQRSTIGNRLFHHFQVKKWSWVPLVTHIGFVQVSRPFEAPSLEEFLITELRPVYNTIGGQPKPESNRSDI